MTTQRKKFETINVAHGHPCSAYRFAWAVPGGTERTGDFRFDLDGVALHRRSQPAKPKHHDVNCALGGLSHDGVIG